MDNIRRDIVRAHAQGAIGADEALAALAVLEVIPPGVSEPRAVLSEKGEVALLWESADECLVIVGEGGGNLRYVLSVGDHQEPPQRITAYVALPNLVREILTTSFGESLQ